MSLSRRAFLFGVGAVAVAPAALATVKTSRKCPDANGTKSGPDHQSKPRVHRPRYRHAVFVSILPEDHMVERPDHQPIYFDGPACVLDAFLSLKQATRRAQEFNRQQLANGIPGREWSFVMTICREQRVTEGGAAL